MMQGRIVVQGQVAKGRGQERIRKGYLLTVISNSDLAEIFLNTTFDKER